MLIAIILNQSSAKIGFKAHCPRISVPFRFNNLKQSPNFRNGTGATKKVVKCVFVTKKTVALPPTNTRSSSKIERNNMALFDRELCAGVKTTTIYTHKIPKINNENPVLT